MIIMYIDPGYIFNDSISLKPDFKYINDNHKAVLVTKP
jgi:hypothetical protein